MRRVCSWLWRRGKPELLAVVAFLATAYGLWWVLSPRSDQVFTLGKGIAEYFQWADKGQCFYSFIENDPSPQRNEYHIFGVHRQTPDPFFHLELPSRLSSWKVSPDGRTLALVRVVKDMEDYELQVMEIPSQRILHTSQGTYPDIGFSPDGRFQLVERNQGDNALLTLHDLHQGKAPVRLSIKSSFVFDFHHAFSPDGRILAVHEEVEGTDPRLEDFKVQLWDTHTGTRLRTIAASDSIAAQGRTLRDGYVGKICFLGGSAYLGLVTKTVGGGEGGRHYTKGWGGRILPEEANLHLFEVATGRLVASYPLASEPTSSASNRFLAMQHQVGTNSAIKICDLQTNRTHCHMLAADERVDHLGFAPLENGQEALVIYVRQFGKYPPWLKRIRGWLGLGGDEWFSNAMYLVDPVSGQQLDSWTMIFGPSRVEVSPDSSRSLLCYSYSGHHSLELYSLPLRRPWPHILGWALTVGIVIELLGRRRWLLKAVRARSN